MPVLNSETIKNAPEWVDISAFGIGQIKAGTKNPVELHYHDAEEYWFVVSGKAKIKTEGKIYTVQKGDVVCTKMGDEHEILEVLEEDFIIVWVETRLKGQKRQGHLHR